MADNEQLLITLGVQDKGTSKQISAITKEIKALDKEFKSANSVSKEFEKSSEGLKTKLGYLEKSFTANNTKLDAYKKKMQETKDAITKKQEELEKLNNAEEVNQKAVNKATEQLDKMKTTLRATEQNISLTENELKRLTNEIDNTNTALKNEALDTYKKKMDDLGESIQGTGGKIKNAGENISGAGTKLLALSAPLVAVGVAAAKVGMDFEAQMSRVQAISGATGNEFDKLKEQAIDLGASTAFSAKESAEGMENLASAGFSTNEIMSAMPGMLDLAASSGEDLASSADIAASTLRGFGLEAEQAGHVADVLAKNAADTNAAVADTGEAMKYAAPMAHALGLSLEETAASIGIMSNAGIKGGQAGTTLRGALTRLTKPTKQVSDAMDEIGITFFDNEGKMKSLSTIIGELQQKTANLTSEQKNSNLAAIFGTEALSGMLALVDAGPQQLESLTNSLKNSDGAASDMAKTMQNNAKSAIEQMFGSLETAGIKLEEGFAPVITNVANKVGELADKFADLSPETQQAIVKFVALTVATGGVLTVTGKVVSGVGSMVTGFGKLTSGLGLNATKVGSLTSGFKGLYGISLPMAGAIAGLGAAIYAYTQEQEAMSKSIVTSKEDLGLVKTALLELNGVHVSSREELEKSGLAYKELGKDLGEDFKIKVNESTKAINDFNFYLGQINMDGVITEEESTGFTSRVDSMVTSAISTIQGKQATVQTEMSKMFTLDDGIVDESEQQVLDYLNKNYTTNIEEVTKLKDDVNAIYKVAIDEKRTLNEQEIKDIQEKTSRIKQIELEALANNTQEQLFAKNEFINRVKQVDADGAKELLISQKKTLDEQNAQTLASYDTQIETMQIARDKAEGGDRENLEKQIALKTEERDKVIEKQRETLQGCIDIVEEMNPNLVGTINKYSMEILTNADLTAQKGIDSLKKQYDGMDEVTTDGWYRMKNTTTGSMDDIYVSVDKNTGEITGAWNSTTNVVGGYTDEMKKKVKELGEEHEIQKLTISNDLGAIAGASVNSKDQMVNAFGEVIGKLENVTTATDGTKKGIIDLNGTPVQITTNADGTITSMHEVKGSMDAIPTEKNVTISFFQKGLNAIKSLWDGITNKNVSIDENATGTYNYTGGLSTVDEQGWELASNNNVAVLSSNLANIPQGTSIRTHMQSIEDMKTEVSRQLNSLMLSGGYYNRDTLQSKQLVNNSNINNNYNSSEIDYNKLANIMVNAIATGLGNLNMNVEVDADGMVKKAVSKTMDTLKRQTRSNSVSKGRDY